MRIIALLFAFVLTGCEGNRLKTETNPTAVALSVPPIAAAFAATVIGSPTVKTHGRAVAVPPFYDLSTPAIGSGPAALQAKSMGLFASRFGMRFDGAWPPSPARRRSPSERCAPLASAVS